MTTALNEVSTALTLVAITLAFTCLPEYIAESGSQLNLLLGKAAFAFGRITTVTTNFSSTAVTSNNATSDCPISIAISSDQSEDRIPDIQCVEKILSYCQPFNFYLLYGTGSIKVFVQGQKFANTCSLHVDHEVEGGVMSLNCSLPLRNTTVWNNWKGGDVFYAVDDLVPFCTRTK